MSVLASLNFETFANRYQLPCHPQRQHPTNDSISSTLLLHPSKGDKTRSVGFLEETSSKVQMVSFHIEFEESRTLRFYNIQIHSESKRNLELHDLQIRVHDICSILFRGFLDIASHFNLENPIEIEANNDLIMQCFLHGFWPKQNSVTIQPYSDLIETFNKKYPDPSKFQFSDFETLDLKTKHLVAKQLSIPTEELPYQDFVDNWYWGNKDGPQKQIKISAFIKKHPEKAEKFLGSVRFFLRPYELSVYKDSLIKYPNSAMPLAVMKKLQSRYHSRLPGSTLCKLTKNSACYFGISQQEKHAQYIHYSIKSFKSGKILGSISFYLSDNIIVIVGLKEYATQERVHYGEVIPALINIAIECSAKNSFCSKAISIQVAATNPLVKILQSLGFTSSMSQHLQRLSLEPSSKDLMTFTLKDYLLTRRQAQISLIYLETLLKAFILKQIPEDWDTLKVHTLLSKHLENYSHSSEKFALEALIKDLFYSHPVVSSKLIEEAESLEEDTDDEGPQSFACVLYSEQPEIFYGAIIIGLTYCQKHHLPDYEEEDPLIDSKNLVKKYNRLKVPRKFYSSPRQFYLENSKVDFDAFKSKDSLPPIVLRTQYEDPRRLPTHRRSLLSTASSSSPHPLQQVFTVSSTNRVVKLPKVDS